MPSRRLKAIRRSLVPVLLGTLLAAGARAAEGPALPCQNCHRGVSLGSHVHADFPCVSCHSNVLSFPHTPRPLETLAGNLLCGQCHPKQVQVLEGSVHGDMLDCQSCHGEPHARSSGPGAGLAGAADVPVVCGACHEEVLQIWVGNSVHGRAWRNGSPGPLCSTCHDYHGVAREPSIRQRLRCPETCGGCHGSRFATYRDSFHGHVTELRFLTAAVCSDCHTPHRILPAGDPESSVSPRHLAETCGQCHSHLNPAFLSFNPHVDPTAAGGSLPVHIVWWLMTGLLVAVFGLFGVHDLLWLQRTLVGVWRGEIRRAPRDGGPHVQRFSRLEVGLHLTVVVSFLTLAATGVPLRFHYTGWAQALAELMGGVESTRLIHRGAAVVTFGYALVHLVQVAHRVLWRGDRGVLHGWRTLIPHRRDLKDLRRHLRYFLYLGPPPRFDRWTYWEKFDYLAVFWGVAIIGLSGLVLWFPAAFTQVLPGWSLNAAYVVHSDEALLAVGFIFIFHFFHTHLRPYSFPMDPVIFTGSMPLDRLREERPTEYRRLVRRGLLERALRAPPSRSLRRFAGIFGATATAIGLALIALILWAALTAAH